MAREINEIAADYNVLKKYRYIKFGQAYTSICNLSEKNTIDLIVLGSHGEYRVRALLDPTANGVLNHEKCDVHLIKMK